MKIVLANGCFDILHVGHVEHLEQAKTFGDLLLVSLTVDQAVNKGPGRPIYTWEERAKVLRALKFVDSVIPTRNAVEAIRMVRPDVFVKGIDYSNGDMWTEDVDAACKEVGAKLQFTTTQKKSATDAIEKAMN